MRQLTLVLLLLTCLGAAGAGLRVPAFTAYLEPDCEGAQVSAPSGISKWKDPALRVLWYGEFKEAGKIQASVTVRLRAGEETKLRLTMGDQSHDAVGRGVGTNLVTLRFGLYEVAAPGYQRFMLESLNPLGQSAGDIEALVLEGPIVQSAHFNLLPRRNAASVHLNYALPATATNIDAFYCEVTAVEEPVWTFYMACGWHRGYFGMQVNSQSERRIIFSVWDSGNEAVDRGKVRAEDRVALERKGEGVYAGDFGHEGTGGHSHLKFLWTPGEKQRFLVTAKPVDATHTVYSGYYYRKDQGRWMLISSWRAPKDGGYLRHLHSFSENFGGANGHLRRKALFGNQWLHTADGQWTELTKATFSHDQTGRADRLDRFMGEEEGQFFLSHGGFVPGFVKFGAPFSRPPLGKAPADVPAQ